MKSIKVTINKRVFLEIADYIGLEEREIKERYGIEINAETNVIKTTVAKLRKISESYEIPISVFFLQEPPQLPHVEDTRALKDELSRESKKAIREAFHIQGAFQEIAEEIPICTLPIFSLEEDPENAGKKVRQILGIEKIRRQAKTYEAFFKAIRRKLADQGILLLQLKLGPELRGFSISDEPPFIMVVSKNERYQGKIYTTFHELGHILLRKSRLDLERNFGIENPDKLERWCETFAASVLIEGTKVKEAYIKESNKLHDDIFQILDSLSKTFLVSKHAIAVELFKQGLISINKYLEIAEKLVQPVSERNKRGGGPRRSTVIIYEKGERFVEEVVRAYERGKITDYEASEILNTKETVWQEIVSTIS